MERYILTTDHPASHYGQPALVDMQTGQAIGTSDLMPELNPFGNNSHLLGGSKKYTGAEYVSIMYQKFGVENAMKYLQSGGKVYQTDAGRPYIV